MVKKFSISSISLIVILLLVSCKKESVKKITGTYTGNVTITLYGYNAGQDSIEAFDNVSINVERKTNNNLILTFSGINNYIIDDVPAKIGDFEYSKESGRNLREDVKGNFSENTVNISSNGFYYPTNRYYQSIQVNGTKN